MNLRTLIGLVKDRAEVPVQDWYNDCLFPDFDKIAQLVPMPARMNSIPHVTEIGSLWDRLKDLWSGFLKAPPLVHRIVNKDVTVDLMALEPSPGPLEMILQSKRMAERVLLTGVMG